MPNPQQPELRRSDKGSTVQDSAETRNTVKRADEGRPHGQDKGNKGGGRGGGVPPDQQPPHPS